MPRETNDGMPRPEPSGRVGRKPNPFEALSDAEVDARIQAATSELAKLGAFQDTSAIPMAHLSDEQLDARIAQVEGELRQLKAANDDDDIDLSRDEEEAVVNQLELLDYLIEHPDASIPPAAALDAIDDEPRRWAEALLKDMDQDVRDD